MQMKETFVSLVLFMMIGGQAFGQELAPSPESAQLPPPPMMNEPGGPPPFGGANAPMEWWRDSELVQKLQVSDEQVQKIDAIVQEHRIQNVDLRAALLKRELMLTFLLESGQPDESKVLAQIDKVVQAKGDLEKSHLQMILAVRRVLSAQQAKRLQELLPAPPMQGGGVGQPGRGPADRPDGPPPDGFALEFPVPVL
jgi:periplasmic protein CpxP/Spy